MIQWPVRALGAVRKLFEPLQDIDVYVEDANDEVFYTNLLKRVAQDKVRIARVFPLGGRHAVVNAADAHAHNNGPNKRRALFIIDGDLEWVTGAPPPSNATCLYRLNAYCIENFLICEKAAAAVLMQDAVLSEDDAYVRLDFKNWLNSVKGPLVNLFCAFGVAHEYAPTYQTVSQGVGTMCSTGGPGKRPELDSAKVKASELAALAEAEKRESKHNILRLYEDIRARANSFASPHDIVSGKDFLLPLLHFSLQTHGTRAPRNVLRWRLALACELERFSAIFTAIEQTARGIR